MVDSWLETDAVVLQNVNIIENELNTTFFVEQERESRILKIIVH